MPNPIMEQICKIMLREFSDFLGSELNQGTFKVEREGKNNPMTTSVFPIFSSMKAVLCV